MKKFIENWKAETPKIWAAIRNLAGFITAAVTVLCGLAGVFPSLSVPEWFTAYAWYAAGISAIITAYAGQKKKKK